jgi:hypothetical protein
MKKRASSWKKWGSSVFVQRGHITNSEEPLREFSMNEEKGFFILEEMGFVH